MTTFAVPDHDAPAIDLARLVAVTHSSRRDTLEAIGLLLGTLGILLGLALVIGSPFTSVR
jgi:hypothetical protein